MANVNVPAGKGMRGGKKAKAPMKTLGRLLKYAFSRNKVATCFVVLFVLLSSVANVTAASRISEIVTELMSYTDYTHEEFISNHA